MKKKKLLSISKLKREADRVFSLWVRNREQACVLCGSRNSLQNGHFISRSINVLRYSEINCHTCCCSCNVFKNGNMPAYAQFMLKTYGPKIIDNLLIEKQRLHQFKREELNEIISRYRLSE